MNIPNSFGIPVLVAGCASIVASATAQVTYEVALDPVDDSYVVDQYPQASYGDEETLFVHSGSNIKRTWLKFDLRGIPLSTITGASLRLYYGQSSNDDTVIDLHHVADDSWSESTVTWSSAPVHDPNPLATATTEFGRNDLDWTLPAAALVADGDGWFSVLLKIHDEGHHSGTASFFSTEATVPLALSPQLFVTVPEPPSSVLLLAATGWMVLRARRER